MGVIAVVNIYHSFLRSKMHARAVLRYVEVLLDASNACLVLALSYRLGNFNVSFQGYITRKAA